MKKRHRAVQVVGVGNCFTPDQPNTSFIVSDSESEQIFLIDCGYNIYNELCSKYPFVLENLNYVVITHLHPDHIGSLGALILHRFFRYGKQTPVVVHDSLKDVLKQHLDSTLSCSTPHVYDTTMLPRETTVYYFASGVITFLKTLHGVTPSFGVWLYDVLFTGDSFLLPLGGNYLKQAKYIFHDCWVTDNLNMNLVHSPYKLIMEHYPPEILKKLIFVHHGCDSKDVAQLKGNFAFAGTNINLSY